MQLFVLGGGKVNSADLAVTSGPVMSHPSLALHPSAGGTQRVREWTDGILVVDLSSDWSLKNQKKDSVLKNYVCSLHR